MERQPAQVFPPGEFINEELEARKWTTARLMMESGLTLDTCLDLQACRARISNEIATRLGDAFGTSADLWLNLQRAYDARACDSERATSDTRTPARDG